MKFNAMFSPVSIGPMTVPNRFVVPPMGNNFANTDGTLSSRSLAYYEARAKGGFGLITIEATVVDPNAKAGPRKPCLFSDHVVESFRQVAEACHAHGAKLSVQLQHAGPEGNSAVAGAPLRAASAIPAACGREIPKPLSTEEVYQLIERYGDAAKRAADAGLDAVEVHCAHGYLIHSFLSSRTNKRLDEFGGCLENRMRIVRLIVENIRKKADSGLAVLCRINACDDVLGGLSVADSAAIARYLQEIGVDGLHVSRAVHLRDEFMWAPTAIHAGFSADAVTEIKRSVTIPVITVGRFTEPYYAELLVEEGRADLVAFGRQSIADPSMPKKSREGRLEEISPCIACLQGCVCNMYGGKPVTCLVNPAVGRESECTPTDTPKHVLVVGGGVGGLLAARVCAQRGHRVSLYEAQESVGGQMRLAAVPPGKGELMGMLRSYLVECQKAGVEIHTNIQVTAQMIQEKQPDVVVLATGAKPSVPEIPGLESADVVLAADVLEGKVSCGKKVLVLGGGMVGCETAAFLGERQHQITVIDRQEILAKDMIDEHRTFVMRDFEQYGIRSVCGVSITQVFADGAEYRSADDTIQELRGFDTIVLALGAKRFCPLEQEVRNLGKEYYVLGDAVSPRRALDATREAWEIAIKL